jgi:hypothetical protein
MDFSAFQDGRIANGSLTIPKLWHGWQTRPSFVATVHAPKCKCGVQVPRSHEETMWIDNKDGRTAWQDAKKAELDQLHECETFKDLGKEVPDPAGFRRTPCHMAHDYEASGRHKA